MGFVKIVCPRCQKRLFDADTRTRGEIYAYCRRCKKSVLITLPKMSEVKKCYRG